MPEQMNPWSRPVRLAARAALSVALFVGACGHQADDAPNDAMKVAVKLARVTDSEVRVTSEYLTTLKSRRSLVLQPQIDGLVTHIFVASGQQVEAGTPILQIDPARQHALLQSEQQARGAKLASLNYLKQQAERVSALYQGGAVSLQELQQARTNYDSARAELGSLGAQVRQQQVQLNYYRVTAPARGTVGDIPVRVGDRVTAATQLTTLSNNELLEAYVYVPVEHSGEVRPGAPIDLVDSSGSVVATTRISFIAPSVSEDLQAVLIKALVENAKGSLRSGQVLRARLLTSSHRSPSIPVASVFRLGGQHFVYAAREDKGGLFAQQRAISVGIITGNDYEVTSGLKAGEQVVVTGIQKLRDGAPLQPES
jgi:RND family efflux transporter MFP subunit